MARFARLVTPGIPHHITHRGNRRADAFLRDEDRTRRLVFLKAYAKAARLDILAYCLMSNHVHLIGVPEGENSLARGVGLAHRRYAVWLNRREGWAGHLWANRYFSTPLDDAHHREAIRYVERNPVRAGLATRAEDYPWSSARAHCGGPPEAALAANQPYGDWGIEDWSDWLSQPEDAECLAALRRYTASGRPCGDAGFVDRLEALTGRVLRPGKRGRKRKHEANDAGDLTTDMLDFEQDSSLRLE
ncbi:MAG: transposase [Candidatus Sumerlaeota bacterium]|nr:transposase [Candidatus Sumerlaeota bacterium]